MVDTLKNWPQSTKKPMYNMFRAALVTVPQTETTRGSSAGWTDEAGNIRAEEYDSLVERSALLTVAATWTNLTDSQLSKGARRKRPCNV